MASSPAVVEDLLKKTLPPHSRSREGVMAAILRRVNKGTSEQVHVVGQNGRTVPDSCTLGNETAFSSRHMNVLFISTADR